MTFSPSYQANMESKTSSHVSSHRRKGRQSVSGLFSMLALSSIVLILVADRCNIRVGRIAAQYAAVESQNADEVAREGEVNTAETGGGEEADPLAVDADCGSVKNFPVETFAAQGNASKVYDFPDPLPEGSIFSTMGFDRFVTVFGIPIVASNQVSDEALAHTVRIFAKFLDNDEDGKVEREASLQSIRDYMTVIGYVSGPEESEALWSIKFRDPVNEEFRNQFVCHMHFFEQWASDATPDYYSGKATIAEMKQKESGDTCLEMEDIPFDWPLWYCPFTLAYYGYLEDFDNATIAYIDGAMAHARDAGKFNGNYPDDREMEMADFFVWSLITKLGALDCHCESEIINDVWKLCTANDLKEFDPEWFDLLEQLEGLPRVLPDGQYSGEALAIQEVL